MTPENDGAFRKSVTHVPLSQKVGKGVFWVTAAVLCARGMNVITAVILARLLAPTDFGLMAIAMAIISFSQGTTQTGFQSALIQKQDRTGDLLNVAWSYEFLRYLFLALIVFAIAPFLSHFFNEPKVTGIVRVLSLSFVVQGLANIGVVYFRRDLDFKKQFIFDVVPVAASILVAVPLAYLLRNVWSLVWATLATAVVTCIISYTMHPHRPVFEFNIKKAKELFGFGKWIFGQGIVVMFMDQAVTMFIGKIQGAFNLGLFNRANTFSTVIFQQVSEVAWKVGYPAYSQLQMEPDKLKSAYLQTLRLLTFVLFPMAGGLLVLSREFVHLFLTDKWLLMVPLIQLMCLQAILACVGTPGAIIFQASGKPAIGTKITVLGVFLLALLIYPFSARWGIDGAVMAILLSTVLVSPLTWQIANRIAGVSGKEFAKAVVTPLLGAGLMCGSVYLLKDRFSGEISLVQFCVLVISGMVVYFGLSFAIDRYFGGGSLRDLLKRYLVRAGTSGSSDDNVL